MKEIPLGLTFDDVLIAPKHSEIKSRSDVITTSCLFGYPYFTPIISSPMDTVTEWEMAQAMHKVRGIGFIHRYMTIDEQVAQVTKADGRCGAAVGLNDRERIDALLNAGTNRILIDVAYCDSMYVLSNVETYKKAYPNIKLMVGNVATADGFVRTASAGADAIRVGIGGGSACSTRITTGVGIPQLSAIMDCASHAKSLKVDLIADGGIRNGADVAKALAAGADFVMLGNLLAGADESPGALMGDSEQGTYKAFRGMASREAQKSKYAKMNPKEENIPSFYIEGVSGYVKATGPVQNTIQQLMDGVRSAFSYVGAKYLEEFQNNAEFIRITHAGMIESNPHDMKII